jgi:hypothetical protein
VTETLSVAPTTFSKSNTGFALARVKFTRFHVMVTTPEELTAALDQFVGSENQYKHWLGIRYTDGVKYLATTAKAYWLIDAIASHQNRRLLSNPRLLEFQIWRLAVENSSATLICSEDTDIEVRRQSIEYTDFPLPEITLYLADKVLMLVSEY